jgi:hypothetical protein
MDYVSSSLTLRAIDLSAVSEYNAWRQLCDMYFLGVYVCVVWSSHALICILCGFIYPKYMYCVSSNVSAGLFYRKDQYTV